jgi:lipoprotein signal peptidase
MDLDLSTRNLFPANAVVDWISLRGLLTFNLADVFVIVGVLMLIGATAPKVELAPMPSGQSRWRGRC